MALAIQHHGLNDAGAWADPHTSIALGFRRLSILLLIGSTLIAKLLLRTRKTSSPFRYDDNIE